MSVKPPRTLRLLVTALILLAVLVWSYNRLSRFWRANAELKAAEEALSLDQFDTAREHLRLCLSVRPNDAEAHFLLGRLERRERPENGAVGEGAANCLSRGRAACGRAPGPCDGLCSTAQALDPARSKWKGLRF